MSRPEDQVSINIFEQISSICKEFRRAWRTGESPRMEDWLSRVDEPNRSTLFSNLLQTEIRFRQKNAERPNSREYLKRFPKFAGLIRSAFDESTMGSMDQGVNDSSSDSVGDAAITRTFEAPAANRLGDYELIRELGRGGMGVVYEARHLQRGNRVALKTLPTGGDGQQVNADRLHKFRKEFRSLSEINHSNLVGMQTLEVDGDQWFFTMDLIEGEDFLSHVRPMEQLDEERLRSALKQLAGGIIFLHERGIVHRDLKPSNVLVDESGRVVILDFGLVAELQTQSELTVSRSGMFAGTPRYAAPEQMFGERSEASDWYAFGTMLYEALTGQPPFVGKQMEVLQQKQTADPPRLVEQEQTEVPEDLAVLTDGLLKREPEQRLGTTQIIEALKLDLETRTSGSTAQSHGSTGSVDEEQLDLDSSFEEDIVLIGREEQLTQLQAAKQEFLKTHHPMVVWVTGKSGEGKSSLVEQFLRPIRLGTEMLALTGRCYDQESIPYKVIDSLIESLVRFLRSQNDQKVEAWLPPDIEILAQLFPILRRVSTVNKLPMTNAVEIESDKLRGRAFGAMRKLLASIAQDQPIVVLIDDLQWGDADSARVLFDVVQRDDPWRLMLIGSYRSDEAATSEFLKQWRKRSGTTNSEIRESVVTVAPLSAEQCLEFVSRRLDVTVEGMRDFADEILQETGGNPYFLDQLLDGFDPATGEFQAASLADVIQQRLARLPNESRSLLKAIAVSGKPLELGDAVEIVEFEADILSVLTRMRSERLVRLAGIDLNLTVDTYHDKIRETVLNSMASDDRRRVHLALAEVIERREAIDATELTSRLCVSPVTVAEMPTDIPGLFDLAFHFYSAGDGRALAYQILSGEAANQAVAPVEAVDYFQKANELLSKDGNPALIFRIAFGLGIAYGRLGDTKRAISYFNAATNVAPTVEDKSRVHLEMGKAFEKRVELNQALKHYDIALALQGRPRPRTVFRKVVRFLKNTFITLVLPKRRLATRSENVLIASRMELEIYQRIAYIAHDLDPLDTILTCPAASSGAALRIGDPQHVALSQLFTSLWLAFFGINSLSRRFLAKSKGLVAQLGDLELRGQFFTVHAQTLYVASELLEFEHACVAAREFHNSMYDFHKARSVDYLRSDIHSWTSSTSVARTSGRKIREDGHGAGDFRLEGAGFCLMSRALARGGQLQESLTAFISADRLILDSNYITLRAILLATRGTVEMYCSNHQRAAASFVESWDLTRTKLAFTPLSLMSCYFRLWALAGPSWNNGDVSRSTELRNVCRSVQRWQYVCKHMRPLALRVAGRALWSMGKRKAAVRSFTKSVTLAREIGVPPDCGYALLDLAAVKEAGSEENRVEAIELLKKMESVIPRAEVWLLGDQYDEAVVAPEFDLEAWEAEHGAISRSARKAQQ